MKLFKISLPFKLFLVWAFLMFSGSAMALTIDSGNIDVGEIDEIEASTYIFEPDDANEQAWIEDVLGSGYVISGSSEVIEINWSKTDQVETAYALELESSPEFYYIWLATNPTNPPQNNAFLYRNIKELAWAVVDITEWEGYVAPGGEINIGRVSHLRDIASVSVPEPATMLMLGSGMLGLVLISRKRSKRNKP
jgi:hypothetical protein